MFCYMVIHIYILCKVWLFNLYHMGFLVSLLHAKKKKKKNLTEVEKLIGEVFFTVSQNFHFLT